MRIIAINTLKEFWEENVKAEQSLKAWFEEVELAEWSSPNDLKFQFGNASVINSKRVIFNIKGNDYRLIVDIEYRLKIIFIVWIGTHEAYDEIDVKTVKYVKTNKK